MKVPSRRANGSVERPVTGAAVALPLVEALLLTQNELRTLVLGRYDLGRNGKN